MCFCSSLFLVNKRGGKTYLAGKNSFVWFGTTPTVIIMNPDQVKDVLLKIFDFQKPHMYPAAKMLVDGLVYYEGEKWATQRKVMTSAFHMEKLKVVGFL